MSSHNREKHAERLRYASRAVHVSADATAEVPSPRGAADVPPELRAPYTLYEATIRRLVAAGARVLELGAGTGDMSAVFHDLDVALVPFDIAEVCLGVMRKRLGESTCRVLPAAGDMERLPFADASFDVVVSAGALSYGVPAAVDGELLRVLRPGGHLICVDSLNHHPVYRLNRLVHAFRGHRTWGTLRHMPRLARVRALASAFGRSDVRYFGSITWAMPVLRRILGRPLAASLSDAVDRSVGVRRSAFKFVFAGEERRARPVD